MQADSLLQSTRTVPLATYQPGSGHQAGETDSGPKNRRGSTRYTAVKESLWLGWWAEDEFVLLDAHLVNISEGGVLIYMERAPVQGQVVWMRLEGTSTPESLAAKVLESRWVTLRRRWVVRLEFQQRCPSDFYETAVFGV
jgi:hypothetical protein